jgi:uncharacterized phage protein (TIGR02218 family)
MSRTIPIAIAMQDAAGTSTICHAMKIERSDGVSLGFIETDVPLEIDGIFYQPGFDLSSLVSNANLAVDNLDVTVLPDGDADLESDIRTGLWNSAAVTLFRVNYRDPGAGIDIIKRGTTGQATLSRSSYKIEFRSLGQALQQPVGVITSKTCRARFADFPRPVPDALCGLSPSDWTVGGSIDSVVGTKTVADSSRTEDADWFANGIFTFTSGQNAGRTFKVKAFADGIFTFAQALPLPAEIGDSYTAIAGCGKRRMEDCHDRFENVVNFQGEPDMPGVDAITASPDPNV